MKEKLQATINKFQNKMDEIDAERNKLSKRDQLYKNCSYNVVEWGKRELDKLMEELYPLTLTTAKAGK